MSYRKVYFFLPFCLFISICYFAFFKPMFNTKEAAFAGKVISIEERKRGAGYLITLREKKSEFAFYYSFQSIYDIAIGDSVFKKSDSKILYVKRLSDGVIRAANDQDFLVPPRARVPIK
jgi:hypothetical protein